QDVGHARVFRGHAREEVDRRVLVIGGFFFVPINHYVHAGGDRVVDDLRDLGLCLFRIGQVGTCRRDAHGGANQAQVPVVAQPLEPLQVFGVAVILPVEPHAAHTLELNGVIRLVTQLQAAHVQLA